MKSAAYQQYIFKQLNSIALADELDTLGKIKTCRRLLVELFEIATTSERLHFATIHSRIAYVAHRSGFTEQLIYQIHLVRHRRELGNAKEEYAQQLLITAYKTIVEASTTIFQQDIPDTWQYILDIPYPLSYHKPDVVHSYDSLKAVALELNEQEKKLILRKEELATETYYISFDISNSSEQLQDAISIIRHVTGLPVILNLLGVDVLTDNCLVPKQIIIEPDYLIDVTAVASSFDNKERPQAWASLSRRLLPYEQRLPLLKGNITNLFLDVLVNEPEKDFKSLTKMIFQTQPLALCCLKDEEVKTLIQELRVHYSTLKQIVKKGLSEQNIQRERCQLEPSFYSPHFGLQGRLDLLHKRQEIDQRTQTSIIELKSGKVFMPNKHGLNQSHFVQTLLYDLMINQAFGKTNNVTSFILYSRYQDQALRYAPPEPFTTIDALAVRNRLLAIEVLIAKLSASPNSNLLDKTNWLIRNLRTDKFKKLSPFTAEDFNRIIKHFEALTVVEKKYLGAFLGFIAREHQLAKTGIQGNNKLNGLASLWLDESQEKRSAFELLDGLTFTSYDVESGTISFNRSQAEDQMVKFRIGDIVVLYATDDTHPKKGEILKGQVFKSTITQLDVDSLSLRLRSRQLSDRFFKSHQFWAIEKDVLDSSFSNHYRGVWAWVESSTERRSILLGTKAPSVTRASPIPPIGSLTLEQRSIIGKILAAEDYFLLWGPPGTGKTSMMLHYTVAHLLNNSQENLLIVAYTNRAVDEICESIERINEGFQDYIRIGSRFGTAKKYQNKLLSVRSEAFSSRAELIEMLNNTRVFVGTVASIGGKEELFKLKQFDRIIIDEASQILEPLMMGLLVRTPKALLIGDHRQLPAVVQQSPEDSKVYDKDLIAIDVNDLSVSLFERLFKKAKLSGWEWCYDQLRYQGRMHADIMAFPAEHFYDNSLDILPEGIPHRSNQLCPLVLGNHEQKSDLALQLSAKRLIFLTTEIDQSSTDYKTNKHEAALTIQTINCLYELYANTSNPLMPGDIGIITPYRAQIANIHHYLAAAGLSTEAFTVDTVERYQGGARRIIIISLCTNNEQQMRALAKTNDELIDRKLNVAMTRAREQLIIIGNEGILRSVSHYANLLDFISDQ